MGESGSDPDRATTAVLPPLSRHRLRAHLARPDQLIVIHAGRLGGATVLLRSWLRENDHGDQVVAAVLDCGPETAEETYWSLLRAQLDPTADTRNPPGDGPGRAFDGVLDALTRQSRPCVVVLDDLHLVDDPVGRVDELLGHAPAAGLRVVAATRDAGVWQTRIARTPGQTLLMPAATRFTVDEVAALLASSQIEFSGRSPEIIHCLTDGIPGLVDAVCSSVPLSELAAPVHLDEHVDAVVDRVVDQMISADPALRRQRLPLTLSAVAEPLNHDSVVPLPGRLGEPSDFIDLMTLGGLLGTEGSPANPKWHLPDSLRRSLLRLARRDSPEAVLAYERSLIDRWLALGRPARALSIAASIEDWPLAARIARDNVVTLYSRDFLDTMSEEVVSRIPDEVLRAYPALEQIRSIHRTLAEPRDRTRSPSHDHTGPDDDTANPTHTFVVPEMPGRELTTHDLMVIRAVELRVRGEFDASADVCEPALTTDYPPVDQMDEDARNALGFALVHVGISFIMAGRFPQALSILRRAEHTAVEPFVLRLITGKSALIQILLGHLDEAIANCERERRHPTLTRDSEIFVRPAGAVASALVALESTDTDSALQIVADLGFPANRDEFWAFGLYARAKVALLQGNHTYGLQTLDTQMPRFTAVLGNGAVARPLLDSMRADLLLAADRADAAWDLVGQSRHPLTTAVRSRILLLRGDPDSALALTDDALNDTRTSVRDALGMELVAASAALELGDRSRALRHTTAALTSYRMTGLLLPFRSLPRAVLGRLAALEPRLPIDRDSPTPDHGSGTLAPSPPDPAQATPLQPEARGPSDRPAQLTEREHQVLRQLATGATISQVAARGYVSINTVKTQVRSIYRKLEVSTRAEALDMAARAGLL